MNSNKVKCTCGWSWNKSDSSKKDMYVCHNCGRDNSNNMKNGGLLEEYQPGGPVAKTDATSVNNKKLYFTKDQLEKNKVINKQVDAITKKINDKKLANRNKAIAESTDAGIINPNGKRFAIGDKFRLFPNDIGGVGEAFDDYVNPAVFVGNTASGLGNAMIDRDPKALAIETALALGAGALSNINKLNIKTNKINPKDYLNVSQAEMVGLKSKRLLEQKNKFVNQQWEDKNYNLEERLLNADKYHNYINSEELGSTPSSLGINKNNKSYVFKDATLQGVPLTDSQKALVASHEVGHYYRNGVDEGLEWVNNFDVPKLNTYLKGRGLKYADRTEMIGRDARPIYSYGDEIRERAGQLKDYIQLKNNIKGNFNVTENQLDDALKNYVKDTGLDNNMTSLFKNLKDKKGLLKTMNKYALGTAGAIAGVKANEKEFENEGWLEKYNEGGEVNYNDYSVSAPEGYEGDGYSNVGRDYSPAWGGQFEDGGEIAQDGKVVAAKDKLGRGYTKNKDNTYNLDNTNDKYEWNPNIRKFLKVGSKPQVENAALETKKYGIPNITKNSAYVKGKSERAFNNIVPQSYGNLQSNLERYEDYQKNRGRPKEIWIDKTESDTGKDEEYFLPKRDDAFSLYLGLPQKNKSFGISQYKPTNSKEQTNYFKPEYLDDEMRQYYLEQSLMRSAYKQSNKILSNERMDIFIPKSERLKKSGISVNDPKTAEWVLDNPLGDFTTSFGKDAQGDYMSMYDKWDLQPFKKGKGSSVVDNIKNMAMQTYLKTKGIDVNNETEISDLFGAGKPFEVYDRIYYDKTTGKIKNNKQQEKQFQMGGSMPGAVGFTYARTGDIPSNGKYAKKTKASAENGTEMQYYQNGLDWKPRNISRDGNQLVKLDQLTNFTNYNKPTKGGWLDKYK